MASHPSVRSDYASVGLKNLKKFKKLKAEQASLASWWRARGGGGGGRGFSLSVFQGLAPLIFLFVSKGLTPHVS